VVTFPVAIAILYSCKLKTVWVLPDLDDMMTMEELLFIYKTTDIDHISKNVYTVSKHNKFMNRYGILLQDLNLQRIGKRASIALVVCEISKKLAICLALIYLVEYPLLQILVFSSTTLLHLMLILWSKPYYDKNVYLRTVLKELVIYCLANLVMLLTDVSSVDQRIQIANIIVVIVCSTTLLFLFFELLPLISKFKLRCKRYILRRK